MLPYEVLLDMCAFLRRADLHRLQQTCTGMRRLVQENGTQWPLNRCFRLTFVEVQAFGAVPFQPGQSADRTRHYMLNTLCRADNLSDHHLLDELPTHLSTRIAQLQFPESDEPFRLFLDQRDDEPTFLLFEFPSGRKFFVRLDPVLGPENVAKLIYWLHQISRVYFEDEIRGMAKWAPAFLEWLRANCMDALLRFRCATLGCYEYEAFSQLDVQFALRHLQVGRLDKANGTIYSPALLQLLFEGGATVKAFCTRWVMNCGPDFTDKLIQHAACSPRARLMIPCIRFTPSFHRQRELPMPRAALVPSPEVELVRQEDGEWHYEEWLLHNTRCMPAAHFRVCIHVYADVETHEEAISQFSLERC